MSCESLRVDTVSLDQPDYDEPSSAIRVHRRRKWDGKPYRSRCATSCSRIEPLFLSELVTWRNGESRVRYGLDRLIRTALREFHVTGGELRRSDASASLISKARRHPDPPSERHRSMRFPAFAVRAVGSSVLL